MSDLFDQSSFASGVIGIITSILDLYKWVIVIRVVISWLNPDPYNPIVQFLRNITDPALDAIRRRLPNFMWSTGLDFTPLILIVGIQILIIFLESINL